MLKSFQLLQMATALWNSAFCVSAVTQASLMSRAHRGTLLPSRVNTRLPILLVNVPPKLWKPLDLILQGTQGSDDEYLHVMVFIRKTTNSGGKKRSHSAICGHHSYHCVLSPSCNFTHPSFSSAWMCSLTCEGKGFLSANIKHGCNETAAAIVATACIICYAELFICRCYRPKATACCQECWAAMFWWAFSMSQSAHLSNIPSTCCSQKASIMIWDANADTTWHLEAATATAKVVFCF